MSYAQMNDEMVAAIRRIAASRTRSQPELFDDAVQEGMIAVWRAQEARPGQSDAYYRVIARSRILDIIRGRAPFGKEGRRGWRDAASDATSIFDDQGALTVDPVAEYEPGEDPRADQIRGAVDGLSDFNRSVVVDLFWDCMSFDHIAEECGLPVASLRSRWRYRIRPVLAAELADLAVA